MRFSLPFFSGTSQRSEHYFRAALRDFRRRKYAKAQHQLKKVFELNPHHKEALVILGQIYIAEENHSEAVRVLERAAKLFGDNADAALYDLLGLSYGNLSKHSDSISAFERAIDIDARDLLAHRSLVLAYGVAGRHNDVSRIVRSLLALAPPKESIRDTILWLAKQFVEARDIWKTHALSEVMFEIVRTLDDAVPQRCSLDAAKGMLAKGMRLRTEIKQKREIDFLIPYFLAGYDVLEDASAERDVGRCLVNLGWACLNAGWYRQAIDISKEALEKLSPVPDSIWEQAQCRETIGTAYGHLGDNEEARKWHLESLDTFLGAGPQQWRKEVLRDLTHFDKK